MTPSQATSFNHQRTLKTVLYTALLLALALAIISPAFADTWSLSAKPNSTTYVQGAPVIINGTLTDTTTGAVGASVLIDVLVYDSGGNVVYSGNVATGTAGTYSTQFIISSTGPSGKYAILVAAIAASNGATVATATATFTVGTTPTPSPSPTATSTSASTPTASPIPEFPSAIVTILLIATATAILFYMKNEKRIMRKRNQTKIRFCG